MKFGGHGELFEGMIAAVHLNGVASQGGQVVEQAAEVVYAVPFTGALGGGFALGTCRGHAGLHGRCAPPGRLLGVVFGEQQRGPGAAHVPLDFFVIVGHGFPEGLVTQIYELSRAFFDLPTEEKNRIGESGPVMGGLMHFGLGEEALAATLRGETIPDLKETLDFGPGFFGDRWPVRPADLEPTWRAYYEAMSTLAATLRSIFATAVGLAPEYFEDKFRGHLSSLAQL